ncbi:MAG: Hsp70 family protein [Planctomycetota bacterium]
MTGQRIIRIYYAAPPSADPIEGIQFARKIHPPPGTEFRWLFRHVIDGGQDAIFSSITNCDVVVADFSSTLRSGSSPDPDVVVEAAVGRLSVQARPVVMLHQQSAENLPFSWRQLLSIGGIRHVTLSEGPDTAAYFTGRMIAELTSQPAPPPPPPRRWSGKTADLFLATSYQRGDGAPGPAGFDFANLFRAVRSAVAELAKENTARPARLAAIKREPDNVDTWYRVQVAMAMSAGLVCELSPDATSGDSPNPDVLTELAFGRFVYGAPVLGLIQKDYAVPKSLAGLPIVEYERDKLPQLVKELPDRLRELLPITSDDFAVAAYSDPLPALKQPPLESVVMRALEPAPPMPRPSTGRLPVARIKESGEQVLPAAADDVKEATKVATRRAPTVQGETPPPVVVSPASDGWDLEQKLESTALEIPTNIVRQTGSFRAPAPPQTDRFVAAKGAPVRGPIPNIETSPLAPFFDALHTGNNALALAHYVAAISKDPYSLPLFNPERFHVQEVLGAGPSGVVFRAEMPATESNPRPQSVVLKVLLRPDWLAHDPDQLFFNVDLLAKAPQNGLLPILGWDRYPRGEVDAWWHFWSPWYPQSQSLAERVTNLGRLTEEETRLVGSGIVRGLMSANVLRIPHHALRPENVLLATDGSNEVWLRDAGFAPAFDRPAVRGDQTWAPHCRRFAAPEQTGEFPGKPGLASDVYSLGLLLLYCLTGSPDVSPQRLSQIRDDRLRQAIEGCLRYDPRTRWGNYEPVLEFMRPGQRPVSISDSALVARAELGLDEPLPVDELEAFGETIFFETIDNANANHKAEEDLAATDTQLRRSFGTPEPDPADAVPAEPEADRPLPLIDGMVKEAEGVQLFDATKIAGLDAAPRNLFTAAPLPPADVELPTYTPGRLRQLICGIDLGTCTSLLAYVDPENGDIKVVHHDQSSIVTPSVVYFPQQFVAEVGVDARRMTVIEPEHCAQFFKLSMGDTRRARPFHGTKYTPEMLSALVLRRLVEQTVQDLGGEEEVEIRDVVITVPSSWDDARRQSTRMAAEMAGVNPISIVSEPVAVSFEVAMDELREGKTVFVYDFGGGTFDVTIFKLEGSTVRLLANMGLPTLGGKDLDEKLLDHVRQLFHDEFADKNPPDPTEKPEERWRLLYRCENVKIALCRKAPPQVIEVSSAGCVAKFRISLEDLEFIIRPEVEQTRQFVLSALLEAGMKPTDIDHVLLVGGSSQIPMVRRMLAEVFGEERILGRAVNPQEAVARGACRNALDIWCEAIRREKIPAAALPASRMDLLSESSVLREQTSQALSLITLDSDDKTTRFVDVVVPQGSFWPATGSLNAATAHDWQANVVCQIRFGNNPDPEGTTELSTVAFPLRPGTPAGTPLRVGFWYDGPDRLFVALWDGRSCETQIKQAPWPGPTPRQIAQWHEIVAETELQLD